MSVVVSVESLDTGQFQFMCLPKNFSNGWETFGPFGSYDEAALANASHQLSCEPCELQPSLVTPCHDVEDYVEISTTNAIMIFGILGIDINLEETGFIGSMKADDFLGYVMVALAQERDNATIQPVSHQVEGSATFIDMGLPEGYVTNRLQDLCDVAVEAQRLGRDILWG